MYRLCDEDWNTVDMKKGDVHDRNSTVDAHRYRFKAHQTRIEIYDVGGQRFEFVGSLVGYAAPYGIRLDERRQLS